MIHQAWQNRKGCPEVCFTLYMKVRSRTVEVPVGTSCAQRQTERKRDRTNLLKSL